MMTTFVSSADAVRCAVAMQQTTRVRVAGERLTMRAGLHVGEVLPDDADYVGASVVVARRLCDRAAAGQILCSGLVVELLNGRRAFRFGELGPLALKGFAAPVTAYEVTTSATIWRRCCGTRRSPAGWPSWPDSGGGSRRRAGDGVES